MQARDFEGVVSEKDLERFLSKIQCDTTTGCQLFTTKPDSRGYAIFTWHRRLVKAHRFAWWIATGRNPIHHLHHICGVKNCVNIAHLSDVPPGEHIKYHRSKDAIAIFCKRGHLFTPDNTIIRKGTNGKRRCRTCANERDRQRYPTKYKKERRTYAHTAEQRPGKYSPELISKLIAAYNDSGETLSNRQLARIFGVAPGTANYWIKRKKN